ncbi:hypothetical protein [Mycobacterium canetti]|uniref:hypothetical protein n=1 Tax=Mycobacterium canetti TaxID=78331 RepID=UPI0002A56DBB|nr:hypothetical protein [Mycobacterium canetti]CCK58949.1 Conserved protein of unknown function [Mycobacterium canettii CIPT 140070010]
MPEVTEADVAGLLAAKISTPGAAIPIITAMAKAYTRGRGFDSNGDPNDEIAAVITTAAARLAGNPRQSSLNQVMADFTSDQRSFFNGWTLAEQFVLNRYRVRAQ